MLALPLALQVSMSELEAGCLVSARLVGRGLSRYRRVEGEYAHPAT